MGRAAPAVTMILAIAAGVIGGRGASAQQAAPDPRVADLVQAGRVRVGLGLARLSHQGRAASTGCR